MLPVLPVLGPVRETTESARKQARLILNLLLERNLHKFITCNVFADRSFLVVLSRDGTFIISYKDRSMIWLDISISSPPSVWLVSEREITPLFQTDISELCQFSKPQDTIYKSDRPGLLEITVSGSHGSPLRFYPMIWVDGYPFVSLHNPNSMHSSDIARVLPDFNSQLIWMPGDSVLSSYQGHLVLHTELPISIVGRKKNIQAAFLLPGGLSLIQLFKRWKWIIDMERSQPSRKVGVVRISRESWEAIRTLEANQFHDRINTEKGYIFYKGWDGSSGEYRRVPISQHLRIQREIEEANKRWELPPACLEVLKVEYDHRYLFPNLIFHIINSLIDREGFELYYIPQHDHLVWFLQSDPNTSDTLWDLKITPGILRIRWIEQLEDLPSYLVSTDTLLGILPMASRTHNITLGFGPGILLTPIPWYAYSGSLSTPADVWSRFGCSWYDQRTWYR